MVADTGNNNTCFNQHIISAWWLISAGAIYLLIVLNKNEKRNHIIDCYYRRFLNYFISLQKLLAGNYRNGHLFAGIFRSGMGITNSKRLDGFGAYIGLDQYPHHPIYCVLSHSHTGGFFYPFGRKTEFQKTK